jgi:hypothetical protein
MSLSAISESTRISEKMLQAMETGRFSVLPQTYIRAFLRAYAQSLDLNPDEILKRYDAVNQEIRHAAEEWTNRSKAPAPEQKRITTPSPSRVVPLNSLIIAAAVLVVIAGVTFLATRETTTPEQDPLSKVPFDKAVHESEAALVVVDSSAQRPQPPVPQLQPVADSLRLEITTTDSLWISVLIDNVRRGQYLFPPGRVHTWSAKEQYVVSMGNAGVASFRLNGRDLGVLGRRGAVARNIVITRSGIQQVQ